MFKNILRRRRPASNERGAVALEAAIALPIAFGLLFVFQDAIVVLQHAGNSLRRSGDDKNGSTRA